MAGQIPIHAVNYRGDNFGCGFYRMLAPALSLQTVMGCPYSFRITDCLNQILDAKFYLNDNGVRIVRLQRWYGQDKARIMKQFLKPLSQKLGFWLVYEIDDVLFYDQIPAYNVAKPHYHPDKVGTSVEEIITACDFISVTTEQIADLYAKRLNIPRNRFIVIPNYLPRWWIGDAYNYERQMALYKQTRNKPRIAMACSMNHFDIHNQNNGIDDFSHIIPWIEHHIKKNDIQFIFVGGVPKQLQQYIKTKQIEYQPPSDIFNYPRQMQLRKMDLLIAPLVDNPFNRCKSNIKWLEFSALGIPMAGQNICTYNKYTNNLFDNANDLQNLVDNLFHKPGSEKLYSDIIIQNRQIVEKGDKYQSRGYWLQTNIHKYVNLYSMPQKAVEVEL